jgi:epoxyqueuosine reductase
VFRGSPVKRAKYSGLKRNVAIAMGNSGNSTFIPDLERLAQDPDPIVAEHAQWALQKLSALVASQPSQ